MVKGGNLSKKELAFLERVVRYQNSPDASETWWQLGDNDKRRARRLLREGFIENKPNERGRVGLRATAKGRAALVAVAAAVNGGRDG